MWVPASTMRSGDDHHQEEDNMTSSNSLDLNNFPNDQFSTDHGAQQILLDHHSSSNSSSAGGHEVMRIRKKSGGGKADVRDEKVYECRFCSLKFCKSQALGGHMNRHRQERETETLNRARQLVFSSDNLAAAAAQGHLGCHIPSYPTNMVDPTAALHQFSAAAAATTTTLYPPRMLSSSASAAVSPALIPASPPAQPPLSRLYPISDYCVGHVLRGGTTSPNLTYMGDSPSSGSYTCIGAPVGQGFGTGPSQMGSRFGHHHQQHQQHHHH